MKVYITNSSSKSIVFRININNIELDQDILSINLPWFSNREKKELLAYKLLIENPEQFLNIYKKTNLHDKFEYIYEVQSPSYHTSANCKMLLSDFYNYKIPLEIKNQGVEKIKEFRRWCKENIYLMDDKSDLFFDRIRWKFNLKENIEAVVYKNSGIESIHNLNLNELESNIIKLTTDAYNFALSTSMKNFIIIPKLGEHSFLYKNKQISYKSLPYDDDEIWETLEEFEIKYKEPLKFLLQEYYKIKYNPELKFEGLFLEQIGFTPCKNCTLDCDF